MGLMGASLFGFPTVEMEPVGWVELYLLPDGPDLQAAAKALGTLLWAFPGHAPVVVTDQYGNRAASSKFHVALGPELARALQAWIRQGADGRAYARMVEGAGSTHWSMGEGTS